MVSTANAQTCLKMANNNPNYCLQCDEANGYYSLIRGPSFIQCAKLVNSTPPYCDFDLIDYPPEPELEIPDGFQIQFFNNRDPTKPARFKSYCFSEYMFKNYVRPGDSVKTSVCPMSDSQPDLS